MRSLRFLQVTTERVEKPEGRVGGVIKPFLLAVGKHVRDQSVADVMRERAQDVAGLEAAAGRQRQAFETDHRVAAPIGEPMITGDDGAHFIAGGVGARRFLGAAGRRDDKLIARENQFGGDAFARFAARPRRADARGVRAPRPSTSLGLKTSMMSHCSVEPIKRRRVLLAQIDLEKSRDSTVRLRAHNRAACSVR